LKTAVGRVISYDALAVPRAAQTLICLPTIEIGFPFASSTILPWVAMRKPSALKKVPSLPRMID